MGRESGTNQTAGTAAQEAINATATHITVCVCTYRRTEFLDRLLQDLCNQETDGKFSFGVVVVDNDRQRSAEAVVSRWARLAAVQVKYLVEPRQGISRARNKAVENASGDLLAFIDDDEFPDSNWLITLLRAMNTYNADGVQGPARPSFEAGVPQWVIRGKFYTRPVLSTGASIDWSIGRTGNVLLKRELFASEAVPFKPELRSGEDQDFFRRMIEKGRKFVWCSEAATSEMIPAVRWKRTVMLRRALLRGASHALQPTVGRAEVLKSVIAVPVYIVALPLVVFLGHHRFMAVLVSLCDHLGMLLARAGINPIAEPYVTE